MRLLGIEAGGTAASTVTIFPARGDLAVQYADHVSIYIDVNGPVG
jgi:hypothetical protein